MAGGDVYITGRIKDIIIRAGRHIYPQEIEEAVADIPGIRKGGVAVFGVTDRATGTERVVVLAETRETDASARAALQTRAHEVATDIAGTPPDEIVLAPPRTVPKTSSGKIRRSAAKELYEQGRIGAPQRAFWWQILRLWMTGFGPRLRRLSRLLAEFIYAIWWWSVMAARLSVRMGGRHDPAAARLALGRGSSDRKNRTCRRRGTPFSQRHRPHPATQRHSGVQPFQLHGRRCPRRGIAG